MGRDSKNCFQLYPVPECSCKLCKKCIDWLLTSSSDDENEPLQESNENPSSSSSTTNNKKRGKENVILVTDLKSFTEEELKQDLLKSRHRNIVEALELLPDFNRKPLLSQLWIDIQNPDKPRTLINSKATEVGNEIIELKTEDKMNTLQVPDVNALTYELEYFPRNAMIIFNHEDFTEDSRRTGTDRDVAALTNTFTQFGFEVTTHDDLERKSLLAELQRFGKQNFEDCGCICVAILTHGTDHGYLKAADVRYSERELFACFNTQKNPTLVAKPIIFLIQACRGASLARSVPVFQSAPIGSVDLDSDSRKQSEYSLPTEADMIIFHSCFFGRASVRVVGKGTWFIQTICEQLNKYASTEHLEDIFRRVRKIIAEEMEFEQAKQMPVMSSTLLKKLYLVPKKPFRTENNVLKIGSNNAHLDSTQNKLYIFSEHVLPGVAVTAVYCCLLYSSVIREHIYLFTCLVYLYMRRCGVSWAKMLGTLVLLLFIFSKINGNNITWEIVKILNIILLSN